MARVSLAEYRKMLEQEKQGRQNGGAGKSDFYPFYNMEVGQRAVWRFVPDANEDNPRGYFTERVYHQLTINGKKRNVECLDPTYGKKCPICVAAREYFATEGDESTTGRSLYKKRQHISQVLIVEDPLPADAETGEKYTGRLMKVALSRQVFSVIDDQIGDPDGGIEEYPWDFEGGYDFAVKKTEAAGRATYAVGTKFLPRQRALSETEIQTYEEGKIDLVASLRPPVSEEVAEALLHAHLTGEEYHDDNGFNDKSSDENKQPRTSDAPRPSAAPAADARKPALADDDDIDVDAMIAAVRNRDTAR